MTKRNLYLNNLPVDEALSKYLSALEEHLIPRFEEIPVNQSLDRITSSAIYARLSSPNYNAAAMDGISVKAASTVGARESNPLVLKHGEDFIPVNTGDPIHYQHDAVIMAEDLIETDNEENVKIIESASPWQHIRPIGEDIVAGEMIIPGRHKIRSIDIGVLFSGGIVSVNVFAKPKVAIIPTGSEIIDLEIIESKNTNSQTLDSKYNDESKLKQGVSPKEGEIIESNTWMFKAQVEKEGGEGIRFSPLPDDFDHLKETILKAAQEFDMVLINAGSSAGTEDYTVQALQEIGEVIVHGVAMKPGKPVILAIVNNKPVIGTPGYPVSAYLAYETFVSPVLTFLTGSKEKNVQKTEAILLKRIVSSLKHREYVRIKAGRVNGKLIVSPLARGAGAAMSLVRADGFCVIDQQCEGIEAGETVSVELFRSMDEIYNTLVSIGSHDLILDVIADMISSSHGINLASTHAGSMAGLASLKRGECHIAPIHLLDEETGNYNVNWVKKIFSLSEKTNLRFGELELSVRRSTNEKQGIENKKSEICLIKGVGRIQGLIIQKNNPLGIKSITDISRCRFINRQRGSGTRLFLDHLLKKEEINPDTIDGYTREAVTHLAVAAALQGGSADAGLGIASAAQALDLDFIPLGEEEYDFAINVESLKLKGIQCFIDTLKSSRFHKKLMELGQPLKAYTWNKAGEVIYIE